MIRNDHKMAISYFCLFWIDSDLLWWCCAWSWWLMHCNYFRNQVIFILIFMILILSVRWFFTVGMGRPEIWVTIVVIWIWPVKEIENKILIHIKNCEDGVTRNLSNHSFYLDLYLNWDNSNAGKSLKLQHFVNWHSVGPTKIGHSFRK